MTTDNTDNTDRSGQGSMTTRLVPTLRREHPPAALVVTMLGLLLLVAGPLRAQIIDRVLAVVVGEPITLSDVTAAIRLGLVPAPAGGEDRVQVALTALIERQLELIEVNRYVPPEPSAAQVEAGLAQVRARFDSQAALETRDAGNGRVRGAVARAHSRRRADRHLSATALRRVVPAW